MAQDAQEFVRIYQSILQDLESWNKEEPLEEFLTGIVKKRLLVDKTEAEAIAQQILSGIESYKEARKLVDSNPQLLEEIKKSDSKGFLKEIVETVMEIFKSAKGSVDDER